MQVLHYFPKTGEFRWRKDAGRGGRIKAGSLAGSIHKPSGYRLIGIGGSGRTQLASRMAWLYMTGEWPPVTVDHIDRDHANDRWTNLRLATVEQNKQNSPLYANNKTGFKGVHFDNAKGKYRATVAVGKRPRMLGTFDTLEEAVAARDAAARETYGGFSSPINGAH